jgi:hypothetical protein
MTPEKPCPLLTPATSTKSPGLKEIGRLDLLTELVLAALSVRNSFRTSNGALAGLLKMTLLGFVDALRLAAAEAQLERLVAVAPASFSAPRRKGRSE